MYKFWRKLCTNQGIFQYIIQYKGTHILVNGTVKEFTSQTFGISFFLSCVLHALCLVYLCWLMSVPTQCLLSIKCKQIVIEAKCEFPHVSAFQSIYYCSKEGLPFQT